MQNAEKCVSCSTGNLVHTGEPPRDMILGKLFYRYFCDSCGTDQWTKEKLETVSGDYLHPDHVPTEEVYTYNPVFVVQRPDKPPTVEYSGVKAKSLTDYPLVVWVFGVTIGITLSEVVRAFL